MWSGGTLSALRAAALSVLLLGGLGVQAAPQRHALIVAIGRYPGLPAAAQLEGPGHDAEALKAVLIQRWGFEPARVQVLQDEQASKRAILDALRELQRSTQPEDDVLIYFSGHGTSALDAGNAAAVPQPDGTGAFIAADFKGQPLAAPIRCEGPSPDDGLVVGCRDLRPALTALDNAQTGRRRLWVISDSCYSGEQVRAVQGDPQSASFRMVPLAYGAQAAAQMADLVRASRRAPPQPYPYRQVKFLAASAMGERAADIPTPLLRVKPTLDGRPHGALTDALLGVLTGRLVADVNGDGWLSLSEVHRTVADYLERRSFAQTPQRLPAVADDPQGLLESPVLRVQGVAAKPQPGQASPLRVQLVNTGPALREALRGLPQFQLASDPAGVELRVVASGGRLLMASGSGDLITGMPDDSVTQAVHQLRQLAWAKQLRQMAEAHRRSVLAAEVEPAAQGGNFLLGQTLSFAVRPERQSVLLLLSVSAAGQVTLLYPNNAAEAAPTPARALVRLPQGCAELALDDPRRRERCVLVGLPLGMDLVMAFGFEQAPRALAAWMQIPVRSTEDPVLADFLGELPSHGGRFSFASFPLRTLDVPRP